MKWSYTTWKAIEPIYHQITIHPFIVDLLSGTLEREKFIFYLQQDAFYLADFSKILASVAVRLTKKEETELFLFLTNDALQVEKQLHQNFLSSLPISKKVVLSPTCLLYLGFLQRQLAFCSLEETVASILPCFWIYTEIGAYISKHQKKTNPYQEWIDTYSGEEFYQYTQKMIQICDAYALSTTKIRREKMKQAAFMAAKMEWMFWDSAYSLEKWKI